MKRPIILLYSIFMLLVVLIMVLAGCASVENEVKNRMKVSKSQVEEFQKKKQQKRVDIYIPIKEQFATSRHTKSLQDLLKRKSGIEPRCYQCMSGDYFLAPQNKKPDPKTVKYSVTCAVCHELTTAEFKLRLKPLDTCVSCHNNGGPILPGKTVHHPQKEMFLGVGAIGVSGFPDAKYKAGLTCIECHMPNEAHTFVGKTPAQALKEHSESICIMCHSDQSEEEFAREVTRIQDRIESNLKQLKAGMQADGIRLNRAKNKGANVTVAQQVYNVIFTNISFVEADKSKGVHNFEYAKKILEYTNARKKELSGLLEGY